MKDDPSTRGPLDERLEAVFRALMERTTTITTLAHGRPNRLVDVSSDGVVVSTVASDSKGTGPQLVPAWMLNVAWRHLRATGSLTNRYLLSSEGLGVRRSSAVCALLAQVPGVTIASSRPVELRYER